MVNDYKITFGKDSSRYLRACRFVVEYGMELDDTLNGRLEEEDFTDIHPSANTGLKKELLSIMLSNRTEEIFTLATKLRIINILFNNKGRWVKDFELLQRYYKLLERLDELFDDEFELFLRDLNCRNVDLVKANLKKIGLLYTIARYGTFKNEYKFIEDIGFSARLDPKEMSLTIKFLRFCVFESDGQIYNQYFSLLKQPNLVGVLFMLDKAKTKEEVEETHESIKSVIQKEFEFNKSRGFTSDRKRGRGGRGKYHGKPRGGRGGRGGRFDHGESRGRGRGRGYNRGRGRGRGY